MTKLKNMTHRGITGTAEYDEEYGEYGGRLLNIYGSAYYVGDSMAELEEKFRDMVEFYIECELEEGRDPYNPPDQGARNNARHEAMPLKAAQG